MLDKYYRKKRFFDTRGGLAKARAFIPVKSPAFTTERLKCFLKSVQSGLYAFCVLCTLCGKKRLNLRGCEEKNAGKRPLNRPIYLVPCCRPSPPLRQEIKNAIVQGRANDYTIQHDGTEEAILPHHIFIFADFCQCAKDKAIEIPWLLQVYQRNRP